MCESCYRCDTSFYDIRTMKCLQCGKLTKINNTKKYNKYCNLYCKDEFYKAKCKKVFNPCKCLICNSEFMPKSMKSKYCSYRCKTLSEMQKRSKKPVTKKCKVCNTEFKPYTSLDKFCSANCRVENMKSSRSHRWSKEKTLNRMGINNPGYVHGLRAGNKAPSAEGLKVFQRNRNEILNTMLETVGYTYCEKCSKSGVKLEGHHIIYRTDKPKHEHLHDKINILMVCVPCHNLFHTTKGLRNELVLARGLHILFGNDVWDK